MTLSSTPAGSPRATPPARWLALETLLAIALLQAAATVAAAEPAHRVQLALQPPTCPPSYLNEQPDELALSREPARCFGTRAPQLELWLPDDEYAWLTEGSVAPDLWVHVDGLLVNPAALEATALGLRLRWDEEPVLELRRGDLVTLTPLVPGRWQNVRAGGGQLWVRLAPEGAATRTSPGRVRRAD